MPIDVVQVNHPESVGVVLPIRSFTLGNQRLADHLTAVDRAELGRVMATQVVRAALAYPTVVITSDSEVRIWAMSHGASVVADPGSLNMAATAGRKWVLEANLARAIIVHADLPYLSTLSDPASDGDALVVAASPCHRGDGTTVCAIPATSEFAFSYGPGSFSRHRLEAARLGLEFRIITDPEMSFDVDLPEDLAVLDGAVLGGEY